MLDLRTLPEGQRGLDALYSWIRPQLYSLNRRMDFHMTGAIRCAWTCFTYNDDADDASTVMHNAPILKHKDALRVLDAPGSPVALEYMLHAVEMAPSQQNCFLHGVDFLLYEIVHSL